LERYEYFLGYIKFSLIIVVVVIIIIIIVIIIFNSEILGGSSNEAGRCCAKVGGINPMRGVWETPCSNSN